MTSNLPPTTTAIVTGASSGIGAACAQLLARRGYRVVLVARRLDRLESLVASLRAAGGHAEALAADLATPDGRAALFAAYPETDVLVNNAGLGWFGRFDRMDWALANEMVQVNNVAMAQLCHFYLPGMRARRRGHIINIGSIVASLPNQGIAIYSASKVFVDNFSTCLYRETRGTGVEVSVVRPGPVRTEFFDQARARGGPIPAERFAIPAEDVGRAVVRLLDHPRRFVYVPWLMRFSPLVEACFGWLIDLLKPFMLKEPHA